MKQITLILALFVMGLSTLRAQDASAGADYKSLENKLEKSNASIQDPKKNTSSKTWLDRAKLFQNIAEVNIGNLRIGMSINELKIFYKEPKEIKKFDDGKLQYIYERMIVTLQYDPSKDKEEKATVKGWSETQTIVPKPLDDALSSYNKAIELDTDGKSAGKIKDGLKALKALYEKKALNSYNQLDYKTAVESFKSILNINSMKQVNIVDTTAIYYTGVAASEGDMKDEAITYFKQANDLNYKDPFLFVRLSKLYMIKGDSTQAINTLKKGISIYPDNVSLLVEMINYYIAKAESQNALRAIEKAKVKDPKNQTFYFVEGVLYDKIGKMDSSVHAYNQAIELDPNYFDAYYNLGVMYFNCAVKIIEKANTEVDNAKYLELKKLADEEFKKAIPFMEKAYEIAKGQKAPESQTNQKQSLETLKQLYYRLKINDQLERVNGLLKAL
jgi:tetratricopeptide (TPR) repeat protein